MLIIVSFPAFRYFLSFVFYSYVPQLVVLVVLQVGLVLPDVAQSDNGNGQVNQRLARGVLAVEVGSLILAEGRSGLLGSRGRAGGQLLVEGDNLSHSLSVGVGANVLDVSSVETEVIGGGELICGWVSAHSED